MVLARWKFRFLLLLALSTSAWAGNVPPFPKLHREYAAEIDAAATLVPDPDRISGLDRFRLAFTLHYTDVREQIGRVLFVLGHQAEMVESLIQKGIANPLASHPPGNQTIIDLGLAGAKLRMKSACPECGGALDDFFRVFDIRDAHDGFSGLPFYGLVQNRFNEARFQREVITLGSSLVETLKAIEENPAAPLRRDLWKLALEATGADEGRAIELLGILTSRDVLITRYLKYLRADNAEFVRTFATAPLHIRLIGDLSVALSGVDVFNYPTAYKSPLRKNYYFWSAALVSYRLKQIGHSEEKIQKLALEFPRQYKTLRFLAARGPWKPEAYKKERLFDAKRVMHASGSGSALGLEPDVASSRTGSPELEAFLNASSDPRDADFLLKSELLRRAETAGKDRIFLYFYSFGDSRIGLSHIKLGVAGTVYEIHRFPNSKGSFLRSRTQMAALRDARSGAMPTGVLEVAAAPEQIDDVIHFLESETDAQMKYSFFNQLFDDEAYNCSGVIHDALRDAGFPLGRLPKAKFLPAFVFEKFAKTLPVVGSAGKGRNALKNLVVRPNLNSATLNPGGLEPNRMMAEKIGYEYLQAEQKLSERTPLFSNPRKAIGYLLKDYSNTGTLPREFTPNGAQTLPVPTALIPEAEVGAYFQAAVIPPENLSRLKVVVGGKTYYRFFIHPLEVDRYAEILQLGPPDPVKWLGTPSSSARSFFIVDEAGKFRPFMANMSLSIVMGGGSRINGIDKLARAIAVNDIVTDIHQATGGKLPGTGKTWSYFPEEGSLMPKKPELGGVFIREIPEGYASAIHLPWFALISDRKGQERWVEELFRYSGYKDKLEFIWRDLVLPLIELQTILSLENGLTTELHQQNIVIRVNPKTRKVEGLVLRDMNGNWVDYSLRRHLFPTLPELTAAGVEEAKLLKYAEAQANQIFSYRNIIRDRTINTIFKYVLDEREEKELLYLADQTMFKRFNTRFGHIARATDLDSLEAAWAAVHAKVTSPGERVIYDSILEGKIGKKSAYIEMTQKLETLYFKLRKWLGRGKSKVAVTARCVELLAGI